MIASGPELVERYLDEGLDEAGAEALTAWLREDPSRAHELLRAARLHGGLRHAVRSRAGRERGGTGASGRSRGPSARLVAPGRWRWLWRHAPRAVVAAAAVVLASLGWWMFARGDFDRPVTLGEISVASAGAGEAPTIIHRGSAPAPFNTTTPLFAGDRLVTHGATIAVRAVRDGTRFELQPGTSTAWGDEAGALRAALEHGILHAVVAKQAPGSVLSIRTPQARAEVIGTEFTLTVDRTTTRLDVAEGTVRFTSLTAGTVSEVSAGAWAASDAPATVVSPYRAWTRGPSADPGFFPLGVWMQDPALAERYRELGIDLFVGLPPGDATAQLDRLRACGMTAFAAPGDGSLAALDHPALVGWLAPPRPDDAPSAVAGGDAGSGDDRISTIGRGSYTPTPPAEVVAGYREGQARDRSRPALLALGAGAAWADWYGRGTRTGHAEDYAQYLTGCDLATFAIDPLAKPPRAIAGEMWRIGDGVDRLRAGGGGRPVWCTITCVAGAAGPKPDPALLRSAAWMALIHGATGLIYAVEPERAGTPARTLLDDPALAAAVTAINQRIRGLAPALNGATLPAVTVTSSVPSVPIATLGKRDQDGTRYLFAISARPAASTATFAVPGLADAAAIEVLDEDRTIASEHGRFADRFAPYAVHLYVLHRPPPHAAR